MRIRSPSFGHKARRIVTDHPPPCSEWAKKGGDASAERIGYTQGVLINIEPVTVMTYDGLGRVPLLSLFLHLEQSLQKLPFGSWDRMYSSTVHAQG